VESQFGERQKENLSSTQAAHSCEYCFLPLYICDGSEYLPINLEMEFLQGRVRSIVAVVHCDGREELVIKAEINFRPGRTRIYSRSMRRVTNCELAATAKGRLDGTDTAGMKRQPSS
jgi:hypothetical protein